MLKSYNRQLAVEPFKKTGIESRVNNGFSIIKEKASLKRLKVIIGNDNINAGDFVYIYEELFRQPWASKVYTLEGVGDFILLPESEVLIVEEEEC